MKIRQWIRTATPAIAMALSLLALPAGASAAQASFYVRVGPPRPVVERRIAAPGPGFVWVPGYYAYNNNAYVWTAGRWERPPRRGARWVRPAWRHDSRRGWYFTEGRWR